MTHRAYKVKAHHQMSTMLPTPTTERLQQKVETDWTPSIAGHHTSQEDVSIFTPLHADQALLRVNESLEVLGKCSDEGRTSPVTSLMETKFAKVGPEEKTYFVRKAAEACKIVCSAIAPDDGETLFKAVCNPEGPNVESELKPLLEAYRNAPSKDTKTQILSIYANKYPARKLIEFHKTYEPITEWKLRKAKLHANNEGPGEKTDHISIKTLRMEHVR